MTKVLKNIASNWFVFFGYFSLFLLTIIAALQIYDANYKITGKYKELANKDNVKLVQLLKTRQDIEAIEAITIDKVFHPSQLTNEKEEQFNVLVKAVDSSLNLKDQFNENINETHALIGLQQAWEANKASTNTFVAMDGSSDEAVTFYRNRQLENYHRLQSSITLLSDALTSQNKTEVAEADAYFKKSIVFINLLIVFRVIILVVIGIIIITVVARLRLRNKTLRQTQQQLIQNQVHLLASQQISKTGSWEVNLSEVASKQKAELSWSDETYRIFGYHPGEVAVTSELFLSHVSENDSARIRTAFQNAFETGVPFEIEHEIILRDGQVKVIHEQSETFYSAIGRPEKMIGTCQDITDRKLSEHKLSESEKEKHRLTDQINRQRIIRQQEITRATIKAQEMERLELGRELHDNVNQILSSSKLFIESSVHNPARRDEMLGRSKELINTCIEELRKLSRQLVPPSLGDLSLKESVEEIVSEYNQIDGKKTVELTVTDLQEDKLSDDLKISIYRIIQEQLNNIRKYAQASNIALLLKQKNHNITLRIEDNGIGFNLEAKRKGLGLTNIVNRAETFNGSVQITTAPDKGCCIHINFKLNKASVVHIARGSEEQQKEFYGTGS